MTGFAQLLHAEWTKFRTVRGWVVAMATAAAVIMGLGLFPGVQGSCGRSGPDSACLLPVGPGGQEVTDSFTFVHQPLVGDGRITVRVTSLTGLLPPRPDGHDSHDSRPGLAPWAKAGIIIKDGTRRGSTYAAVMITGGHGVRMQHDYTHDRAGQPGAVTAASPRWLRLTRTGDAVTGDESADGTHWTTVGTAHLAGLPSTVQAGLFATSPQYAEATSGSLGAAAVMGGPTRATAVFDHLDPRGAWPGRAWTGDHIGGPGPGNGNGPGPGPGNGSGATALQRGGFEQTGEGFTVTGSGDIAPAVASATGVGTTIAQTLVGTFAGLIIVVVVGTMFVTAEYRRGLIRTTLAASPLRGRTLAAKAIVIGAVTYVTGLVAAAVVVTLGQRILRGNGVYVHPATTSAELRVVAGTAALLAVAAVLALALGALLRRGTTAVAAAIVAIVAPYLLALTVLPAGAAQWLLRIAPAAAFALQQSSPQYPQVANVYTPANGYFPLAPWTGFAVLAGWAALALGLAAYLFRRRDA
jgi:ABC-type transport system involved in multi-copper enzyme maturation permease subunit